MAVTLQKQDEITVIVQEIENTGATFYNINGVDLSRAEYLYIAPTQTSKDISLAEYEVKLENGDQNLYIYEGDAKDTAEIFQIIYKETIDSSQYTPVGDADVEVLTIRYNELQEDFVELWNSVASSSMKSDTISQSQILPLLGDGETWYWDDEQETYRGIAVANVELNVERVEQEGDTQVARVIAEGDTQETRITDLGDTYVLDMTALRDETEGFRDEAEVLRDEMILLVDQAILDNGHTTSGDDIHTLAYGYWWTTDVTTLLNGPSEDLLQGMTSAQISIKESDGNPVAREQCTFIIRGSNGITLYQIQTGVGTFTNWMSIGYSASVIPYDNTNTTTFPTGLMRLVYWDGVDWSLAYGDTPAFGVAVRVNATTVNVYLEGTIILDPSDTDADGVAYVDRDYYFLSNSSFRAGKLEVDKPEAGIFQSIGRIYTLPSTTTKYMQLNIEDPSDITPIVYTDQGETQIVLRPTYDSDIGDVNDLETTSKEVVGAINELKAIIDTL